jgi:lysozyme
VTPAQLYELIRRFEGCRLRAYRCPAGVWTCGWGSTGPDVGPGTVWTIEQASARMRLDAQRFARGTLALCPGLNEPQLAALADFAYNLGLTRLKSSTLRRRVLAGDWEGAAIELGKWVRCGARVLPGLVLRRQAEAQLVRPARAGGG